MVSRCSAEAKPATLTIFIVKKISSLVKDKRGGERKKRNKKKD